MSVEQPFVSILIASYNYGDYLKEAIDSALNQTYPHTEVIAVDDGSVDNSPEIIASYGDRIIPIYKQNGGQGSAFNAGFAVSRGDIVCFLDSDDVWLPQKVEKVVEAFTACPLAVVAYHKIQNIDRAGNQFGKPWPPYKSIRGNVARQVARSGGWWPFPPSSALSYRREFLDKVMDIPEPDYRQAADAYLADLAPFFGEVAGIDRVLSYFRLHGSNNWSNPSGVPESVIALRKVEDYEFRAIMLNRHLKRAGIDLEISLADHWPYQLLQYKLGKKINLISLCRLALQNPWEPRVLSKLKLMAELGWQRGKLLQNSAAPLPEIRGRISLQIHHFNKP